MKKGGISQWRAILGNPRVDAIRRRFAVQIAFVRARLSPRGYLGLQLTLGALVILGATWLFLAITEDVLTGDPLTDVKRSPRIFDLPIKLVVARFAESRGSSTVDADKRRASQERRAAAENESDQIFERRFVDRVAVKLQAHAIEPVDIGQ